MVQGKSTCSFFNDMLVYASRSFSFKKSEEQYKSHRELSFKEGIKFIDLQAERWSGKSGFMIVHPSKTFKVFAETELEKRQWMAALKSSKGVYYNTSSFSPPSMVTYKFNSGSQQQQRREMIPRVFICGRIVALIIGWWCV